ncbi:hypothetical protein [Flavobacterium fluviatile]|uniref:hypothetical protein n=1 Tax=Flavobacterium fluviatile TaxID=1862387 RepID=UPI0013D7E256|nr:hypothetical protein [Flavobacterium fluviatile]
MKHLKRGVKSENRLNVEINKNFIILVNDNPKNTKKSKISSANKVSELINDEKLKIKLFNKALESGKDKYTVSVRNRLKIDFYSK